MSDLISRTVDGTLRREPEKHTEERTETHACDSVNRRAALDCVSNSLVAWEAYEAIEALPSAQQWIPCSERLPEKGHDVLITKKPFKIKGYEQEVIKAKRSVDPRSGKIEWWSPEFGALKDKAVLAWMPLPEPYGGE